MTPDVTYTRVEDERGEIKDLSGPGNTANIAMANILDKDNAVLTETDGARPVIVVASDDTSSTGDRNSDGFIDQLTVTFSEPVTADSGNIGITVDKTASGNTVTLSEVLSGGGSRAVVFAELPTDPEIPIRRTFRSLTTSRPDLFAICLLLQMHFELLPIR